MRYTGHGSSMRRVRLQSSARIAFLVSLFPSVIVCAAAGTTPPYLGLPAGATVLEEAPVPTGAHAHRALILWVMTVNNLPVEDGSKLSDEDVGGCPGETIGHGYNAPTRVSLVDTESKRVLNSVAVKLDDADEYPVPVWVRPGFAYATRAPLTHGWARPHIFTFKDFNGDGKALEFALYVMESCNGPLTMVMGYSERQDRVIVYDFVLTGNSSGQPATPQRWMYRFAAHEPIAPMHWKYDEWYNSGLSQEWEFRFVPDDEKFEGTTVITDSATKLRNIINPRVRNVFH
jgi:hypothetical protein